MKKKIKQYFHLTLVSNRRRTFPERRWKKERSKVVDKRDGRRQYGTQLQPLKWKMEGRNRWKKARQRLKPLKWTHTLCPVSCDPSDTAVPCKDSHFFFALDQELANPTSDDDLKPQKIFSNLR